MFGNSVYAQKEKVKNRPHADQKMFSLGFTVGINMQDLILSHSGFAQPNGEVWFAEIPSYNPGFSVGIIADRYLNEHLNLRLVPSLHFGEKQFTFKEQTSKEIFKTTLKTNYLTVPLLLKYSAKRLNNFRPYVLGGVYGSMEIGGKKNMPLRAKGSDYGLEFGFGCNFYMPLFKFCPEIRFSLGLKDMIQKDRSDLVDKEQYLKYTEAFNSGKSRMIIITFNFE
nr:porin family protein [Dysgonomonas sp. 216]